MAETRSGRPDAAGVLGAAVLQGPGRKGGEEAAPAGQLEGCSYAPGCYWQVHACVKAYCMCVSGDTVA